MPFVFDDSDEIGALIGALDWSTSSIGAPEIWPRSLRATVDLILASPIAMIAVWGPELVQIYNTSYAWIAGSRHPRGLGQPTRECWPEVWQFNAPVYDG